MTSTIEPRLAPPGAGLPLPELMIARLLFGIRCRTGNKASFTGKFVRERSAIQLLLDRLDGPAMERRVLIRRPPGLEDSSRYWSVLMTLDHLRIVHHAFIHIIGSLSNGVKPEGEASTAAVKPDREVTDAVVAEYEASCDALLATVDAASNMKTAMKFPHPWFGPMDAFSWHALAGGHMGIHRVQIARIIAGQGTRN